MLGMTMVLIPQLLKIIVANGRWGNYIVRESPLLKAVEKQTNKQVLGVNEEWPGMTETDPSEKVAFHTEFTEGREVAS